MEEEGMLVLRIYFDEWRRNVKLKKEKEEAIKMKQKQREKIDALVKVLKKYKKKKQQQVKNVEPQIKEPQSNFKNRFEAQKGIIEKLTLKLEEKDRLIEELKLGVFDKDALKTLNQTKIEIREIFANCSAKVRSKLPPPPDYNEKFMITTQKAPKIVQEMEERALERAKRREIILERKRIIEDNRRRMIAEALEKKRIQDEEEKKRSLENIKERRRKEMEKQKIREANKMNFLEKLKKALALYKQKLMQKGFRAFFTNYKESRANYEKSVRYHKIKLLSQALHKWKEFVESKYQDKNALADAVFAQNILSRVLKRWREMRIESVRSMQVAEDFHDLLLLNNTFVHWHRHVCIQIMLQEKKMKMAQKHYNGRILCHYFYQWRSLPAVIQLEKSKEMMKKKWRARVWEILPDYKPPTYED